MSDTQLSFDAGETELARVRYLKAAGEKLRKRDLILLMLADAHGAWVNGLSFLTGNNSQQVFVSSYSQRIGDLRKTGVPIECRLSKNNPLGEYRLVI